VTDGLFDAQAVPHIRTFRSWPCVKYVCAVNQVRVRIGLPTVRLRAGAAQAAPESALRICPDGCRTSARHKVYIHRLDSTASSQEVLMAPRSFKSILVGIEAPRERRQLALQRAAQLAQRTGARLTLFHSAFSPYSVGPQFYGSNTEKAVRKTLVGHRAALEKLAAPLRRKGLKVSTKVAWDYPVYEAIVRETLRARPDLVVAGSHRRAFGARLFLTNTDWQLIRLCPASLLFVKQERAYGRIRVLAAVDPLHATIRPAQLDRRILESARTLADAGAGRLDVVHAWMSPLNHAPVYGLGITVPVSPEIERESRRRAQRALTRVTAGFDVPEDQLHLAMGSPGEVLPAMARRLRADVLVMGAISRRGLARLFIGSTAERTLDRLPCDVLVVKARGFKTDVPRRFAALQLDIPPM